MDWIISYTIRRLAIAAVFGRLEGLGTDNATPSTPAIIPDKRATISFRVDLGFWLAVGVCSGRRSPASSPSWCFCSSGTCSRGNHLPGRASPSLINTLPHSAPPVSSWDAGVAVRGTAPEREGYRACMLEPRQHRAAAVCAPGPSAISTFSVTPRRRGKELSLICVVPDSV